ncbi:MAG: hypothetical protein ISR55_08050 [Bacteroidetes bacterium]|nr:hypothetical protein [Bacteroidota bacterium]MBL6963760.1 hypothetical protein [Bacteroidota bacterium]
MKKRNLLLAAIVISVTGFFTACEEPAGLAPVIAFLNNVTETTLAAGVDSFTVAGTITSENGLAEVKLFKVTATGETQIGNAITTFTDKTNYAFQFFIQNIDENTTVKVEATDESNLTKSANFMIIVTGGAIDSWTETLGAQSNTTTGSSFASSNGQVYLWAAATANSSLIDFIYFYGATNQATLAAPDDTDVATVFPSVTGWATRNDTRYANTSLSAANFDAIMGDNDIITAATGASDTKANHLANGDVVAFITAAGKMGLVKIGTLTASNTGTMEIAVKVQQ